MNSISATTRRPARVSPRIEYRRLAAGQELPANVLLAVSFGAVAHSGPRRVTVGLEPLAGQDLTELWLASGAVVTGDSAAVRFSHDEHFLAGAIEVSEREHGGITAATAFAYRAIAAFQSTCAFPHLLRTWNYFDAINDGAGDSERYRGFCSGRVAGLGALAQLQHPAATVIGGRGSDRVLQIYWLAGREPGIALENPRQVSAFRYPREYGETPPTFSRAMLVTPELLMISGTASIVGHASQHRDDAPAQVREIFANLDSLLTRAQSHAPSLPAKLGSQTLIKVYLRRRQDLAQIEQALRERFPAAIPLLVLHGDVCRAELLVELDCLAYVGG